jgi:hypothetical protein
VGILPFCCDTKLPGHLPQKMRSFFAPYCARLMTPPPVSWIVPADGNAQSRTRDTERADMQIKLLEQRPRREFAHASVAVPSTDEKGWRGSKPVSLDSRAARLMEVEALRLAARAGQARIAADHAADADRRLIWRRAAEAFEVRARSFEALLAEP